MGGCLSSYFSLFFGCKWANLIYHHQKPEKRKNKSKQISLNSSFYVKIECFLNFFLSVAMSHLIYPSPKKRKKKKKKNLFKPLEALQKEVSIQRLSDFPLAKLYRWKEDNFEQNIWDKKHDDVGHILGNTTTNNSVVLVFFWFGLVLFSVLLLLQCKKCHKRKHDDDVHDYKQPMN